MTSVPSDGDEANGATVAPLLPGRKLLATLGVWIGSSVAVGGATAFVAKAADRGRWDVTPVITAEVYVLFVVSTALVMRGDFWGSVALKAAALPTVLLALPVWASAYVATGLLQSLVGSWSSAVSILRAMGSDDGRLAHVEPVMAAIILARACVLAPVGEELLFRGALFTWLRQCLTSTSFSQ